MDGAELGVLLQHRLCQVFHLRIYSRLLLRGGRVVLGRAICMQFSLHLPAFTMKNSLEWPSFMSFSARPSLSGHFLDLLSWLRVNEYSLLSLGLDRRLEATL